MRGRSVRFKMTAWLAGSLIVIVLISFAIMYLAASSVLFKTSREYLMAAVDANTGGVNYLSAEEAEEFSRQQADAQRQPLMLQYGGGSLVIDENFLDVINDVYIGLYTEDGAFLYGMDPLALASETRAFASTGLWRITFSGERYEVYDRKLVLSDTEVLWLRGVLSLAAGREQLADITRICVVLLPALIVLAILGGYLLAGRLLKPVANLTKAAEEISGGTDLKRRIAMKGPDDELHRLADAFDGMFERLDASFEAERTFATQASHALRTPATVILSACEYTLKKERTTAEYEDTLRIIRRQASAMSGKIIETIHHFRTETGLETQQGEKQHEDSVRRG